MTAIGTRTQHPNYLLFFLHPFPNDLPSLGRLAFYGDFHCFHSFGTISFIFGTEILVLRNTEYHIRALKKIWVQLNLLTPSFQI